MAETTRRANTRTSSRSNPNDTRTWADKVNERNAERAADQGMPVNYTGTMWENTTRNPNYVDPTKIPITDASQNPQLPIADYGQYATGGTEVYNGSKSMKAGGLAIGIVVVGLLLGTLAKKRKLAAKKKGHENKL